MPLIRSSLACGMPPLFLTAHRHREETGKISLTSPSTSRAIQLRQWPVLFAGIFHHVMSALSCNHETGAWYNLYVRKYASFSRLSISRCLHAPLNSSEGWCQYHARTVPTVAIMVGFNGRKGALQTLVAFSWKTIIPDTGTGKGDSHNYQI